MVLTHCLPPTHGALQRPSGWRGLDDTKLRSALDAVRPTLTWRGPKEVQRIPYLKDPQAAQHELSRIVAARDSARDASGSGRAPLAWLFPVGCVVWLLLLWLTSGRMTLRAACVAATTLALCAWWFGGQESAPDGSHVTVPTRLVAPLAGGDCESAPPRHGPDGWVYAARCDGRAVTFTLRPSAAGTPEVLAETVEGGAALVESARLHVLQLARRAVQDGFVLTTRSAHPKAGVPIDASGRVEIGLTAGLAGLGGFALLVVFGWIFLALRPRLSADRVLRLGLLGAFALTLILHIVAPGRMVMEYTGYDLTTRLGAVADLPRYGAGAVWLYRPFFLLGGVDHETTQLANRFFGALTLLPLTALTLAWVPRGRVAPLFVAFAFALSPVFLRDHTSEAIQAGAGLLLITGLAAFVVGLRRRRDRGLTVLSMPILAWAATTRPEVAVALVPLLVAVWFVRRRVMGWRALGLGVVALASWLLAHAVWMAETASRLVDTGAIAGSELATERLAKVWLQDNILLDGLWVPWIILACGLLAFLQRGRRVVALGAWLAILLYLGLSSVDLPHVSVPRVHLPAVLLLLPVAAVGLMWFERRLRGVGYALFAGTVVWSLVGMGTVLAPTNGDAEEALFQRAVTESRARGVTCVGVMDTGDLPAPGSVPRYVPRYLFSDARVVGLRDLERIWPTCGGRALVILGMRCFTVDRDEGEVAPLKAEPLAGCVRAKRVFRLAPVVETRVPNRDELALEIYPQARELPLGIYLATGLNAPKTER